MAESLTRRERDMLAFERHFAGPGREGVKEALASKLWPHVTPVRYQQLLFALVQRAEAEAAAPNVVRRLRRIEAARRRT